MTAIDDIAAERKRQIETEGWNAKHDDREHGHGDLAIAAACYAAPSAVIMQYPDRVLADDARRLVWPWERQWWKPKDERRNLVRAGALIVAEIERLDRRAFEQKAQRATD